MRLSFHHSPGLTPQAKRYPIRLVHLKRDGPCLITNWGSTQRFSTLTCLRLFDFFNAANAPRSRQQPPVNSPPSTSQDDSRVRLVQPAPQVSRNSRERCPITKMRKCTPNKLLTGISSIGTERAPALGMLSPELHSPALSRSTRYQESERSSNTNGGRYKLSWIAEESVWSRTNC